MLKQAIKSIFSLYLLATCSGCSQIGYGAIRSSEHGIFTMSGDSRGLEAYAQSIQGFIEASKHKEGKAPSTHEVYKQKEEQRTKRRFIDKANIDLADNPFADFLSLRSGKQMGRYTKEEKSQVDSIINNIE